MFLRLRQDLVQGILLLLCQGLGQVNNVLDVKAAALGGEVVHGHALIGHLVESER